MAKTFFVAGTDTDAGKTLISCGLLTAARKLGLRTLALKPVAAGAEAGPEGPVNRDALLLLESMTEKLPYSQVNPVLFASPVAPHIAAAKEGRRLQVPQLAGYCRGALMKPADFKLIEGAGGWRVPLNMHQTMANLAVELDLPVIMVVGMKLGCLNHALLTAQAIVNDGLELAGWVANRVDPQMACFEENMQTLAEMLGAPCLGIVPHLAHPEDLDLVAGYLDLSPLGIPDRP